MTDLKLTLACWDYDSLRPAWNDHALSGLLRKREPRRP
jgi:hypothetical protein